MPALTSCGHHRVGDDFRRYAVHWGVIVLPSISSDEIYTNSLQNQISLQKKNAVVSIIYINTFRYTYVDIHKHIRLTVRVVITTTLGATKRQKWYHDNKRQNCQETAKYHHDNKNEWNHSKPRHPSNLTFPWKSLVKLTPKLHPTLDVYDLYNICI